MNIEQTWDLYCREISATFEHLHQFETWVAKQCNTTLPDYYQRYKSVYDSKYKPKLYQISQFLADFSPVGEDLFIYQGLLEAYSWITICLLANTALFTFGHKIFYPFISEYYAFYIRFLALIFIIYAVFANDFTEEKRRLYLLTWSVVEGFLVGCLSNEMYLTYLGPPVYGLSASIGFASIQYNKNFCSSSRSTFIAVSLVPGVFFSFLFAILFGKLNFLYMIWIILLFAVVAADLLLKIGRLREGSTVCALEQLCSIFVLTKLDYLCMYLFAVSYKGDNY